MGDEYRSRVLVTGGSGFIGRRLVRALVRSGAEVTVADLRAFPDDTVRSVVGDLCDPSVVEAAVSQGTEAIIHLAAVTRVLLSIEDPAGTHALNVDATAGLLEQAAADGGVDLRGRGVESEGARRLSVERQGEGPALGGPRRCGRYAIPSGSRRQHE
jgi:nucleoside-diphosphate-sugar epimerase